MREHDGDDAGLAAGGDVLYDPDDEVIAEGLAENEFGLTGDAQFDPAGAEIFPERYDSNHWTQSERYWIYWRVEKKKATGVVMPSGVLTKNGGGPPLGRYSLAGERISRPRFENDHAFLEAIDNFEVNKPTKDTVDNDVQARMLIERWYGHTLFLKNEAGTPGGGSSSTKSIHQIRLERRSKRVYLARRSAKSQATADLP